MQNLLFSCLKVVNLFQFIKFLQKLGSISLVFTLAKNSEKCKPNFRLKVILETLIKNSKNEL